MSPLLSPSALSTHIKACSSTLYVHSHLRRKHCQCLVISLSTYMSFGPGSIACAPDAICTMSTPLLGQLQSFRKRVKVYMERQVLIGLFSRSICSILEWIATTDTLYLSQVRLAYSSIGRKLFFLDLRYSPIPAKRSNLMFFASANGKRPGNPVFAV